MKYIILFFVILTSLSCRSRELPKEYMVFLNELRDGFGDPSKVFKKEFHGKDSAVVTVFVYDKNFEIGNIVNSGKFKIHYKDSEEDLTAHWLDSTLWDSLEEQHEEVSTILMNGLKGKSTLGYKSNENANERFMFFSSSNKSYFLYEVTY